MVSSRVHEGDRCIICGQNTRPDSGVPAPDTCPHCGNPRGLDASATLRLSLSAFPILDQQTQQVLDRIRSLVEQCRPSQVRLDFQGVMFVSSAALGKLIVLARKTATWNARVALCNLDLTVKELLDVTNVGELFDVQ